MRGIMRSIYFSGIAFLLFFSWLFPPTRYLWDGVDRATFTALNGSLSSHPWWATLCGLASLNSAKYAIAFLMSTLYLHYLLHDGEKGFVPILNRFMLLTLFTLAIACCIGISKIIFQHILDFHRQSPTILYPDAFRLSTLFPGHHLRDSSANSFPGDNATVLFSWMSLLWFLGGKRYGMPAAVFAIAFSFPRLISGAHWLTDIIIGAGGMTLLIVALLISPPVLKKIYALSGEETHDYESI